MANIERKCKENKEKFLFKGREIWKARAESLLLLTYFADCVIKDREMIENYRRYYNHY